MRKNLLRQLLEEMMKFFASSTAVQGGSLLTDSDMTTEQVIYRALQGELDLRESVVYRGHTIKPRYEASWPYADRFGFWVVKDHANVMPGAAWFQSIDEAKRGIDHLLLAKDSADTFWLLSGNAGLDITTTRAGHTIRSKFAPGTFVSQIDQDIALTSRTGLTHALLTPKQALAAAAMLKDAAERALGKK